MESTQSSKTILVTGGAGFIGCHVVKHLVNKYPSYHIVNFDALTYAGNLENLKDIENMPNYTFVRGDIVKDADVFDVFKTYGITDVIHLAAESHVDRSIKDPNVFVMTNVIGTINLLNAARYFWNDDYSKHRFHHVSTDEVYGALDMNPENKFTEDTPYSPHSPYSAAKASSDHFVKAYHGTYGLNVTISNCSNNYGPNQFPEKLIPLVINNLKTGRKIPVYGKGENVRDWLYVEDHAKAIDVIFHKGRSGETYNVGGKHEMMNIDIVKTLISTYKSINNEYLEDIMFDDYIEYVTDRAGHDLRYAIDCSKLERELGWSPEETFETGIRKTVHWYLTNNQWLNNITSGDYKKYYEEMYNK